MWAGDLSRGAYDEQGQKYDVPLFCCRDPVNLLKDPGHDELGHEVAVSVVDAAGGGGVKGVGGGGVGFAGGRGGGDGTVAVDSKGKMPAKGGRVLLVWARLSDRDGPGADVAVRFDETASVASVAKLISTKAKVL